MFCATTIRTGCTEHMPRSVALDDFVHGDSITVVTETGEELVVPVENTSADCDNNEGAKFTQNSNLTHHKPGR